MFVLLLHGFLEAVYRCDNFDLIGQAVYIAATSLYVPIGEILYKRREGI